MNKLKKLASIAAIAVAVNLGQAAVVVLDFEGVGNFLAVGDFYNGGAGTNYGIAFSDNALGIIDADAGGNGDFGGEPSPNTVLFFLEGAAATMNVAAGFTTGFSFFYSAVNFGGSIVVWDGLNATGNILATLDLPLTPAGGAPDPTGLYSPFVMLGVAFDGTAMSVDFGGTIDEIGFDDITLGSIRPGNHEHPPGVPDSGSTALMILGSLAGLAGLTRRHK